MPTPLPPVVLAFVADHIRSLEELQLLMAVIHAPERWWDAATAARELILPLSVARRTLDHFAAHNLLDIRITGDVRYQFHPGTDDLRAAARACVEAYDAHPQEMVELVKGKMSVRDFSDAFRIRRDDDR